MITRRMKAGRKCRKHGDVKGSWIMKGILCIQFSLSLPQIIVVL